MATPEYAAGPRPPAARDHRPAAARRAAPAGSTGSRTTDHKKIGILYLFTTAFFFLVGGVEALLMRIQLGSPDNTFLDPTTYSQLFTLHGTTMIFLVVVPIAAGFGELPRAAHDRRPRHGVPAPQHAVVVAAGRSAAPCSTARSSWRRRRPGWTSYAPLSDDDLPPRPRHRRVDPRPAPHRDLLDPRRDQLHRHDPQHARARACR